ncbi:MAG: hypothetical protein PHI88_01200 [Candidatus Pacebacteria bacterium]|nr:hypothetical protein [Candidatus Paceibacterota bacterium]
MAEEPKYQKEEKFLKKELSGSNLEFEAKQNLLGFFDLLLKIDRRNHPEKYKRNNKHDG